MLFNIENGKKYVGDEILLKTGIDIKRDTWTYLLGINYGNFTYKIRPQKYSIFEAIVGIERRFNNFKVSLRTEYISDPGFWADKGLKKFRIMPGIGYTF